MGQRHGDACEGFNSAGPRGSAMIVFQCDAQDGLCGGSLSAGAPLNPDGEPRPSGEGTGALLLVRGGSAALSHR